MDVTRANFTTLWPLIEEKITECDFVAIDAEFTGLGVARGKFFDLPSHRYDKARSSSSKYSVIQLGLSCFKRQNEDDEKRWKSTWFTFYVFPHKIDGIPRNLNREIVMDTDAVSFLIDNGFDFNFLYSNGLSYMRLNEEDEVSQLLNEQSEKVQDIIKVPPEEEELIKRIVSQVESFLKEQQKQEPLELEPCNAFQRKLIYSSLAGGKFKGKIDVSLKKSHDRLRSLTVTKTSDIEKQAKRDELISRALGVSKVIQLISTLQKPLIGHNIFLDLIHIMNQFICPLPESYIEFKEAIHQVFPQIYDTKYIASASHLGLTAIITDTTLDKLYSRLNEPPFTPIDMDIEYFSSSKSQDESAVRKSEGRFHQAGYDSFITGYSFILLNNYINEKITTKTSGTANTKDGLACEASAVRSSKCSSFISPEVVRLSNLVCMSFSFDYSHFNLAGTDVDTSRKDVFYVTFPSSWKTKDLQDLFSPFAGKVRIEWLTDTSAFVGLSESSTGKTVHLPTLQSKEVKVLTYQEYHSSSTIAGNANTTSSTPQEALSHNCRDASDTRTGQKKQLKDEEGTRKSPAANTNREVASPAAEATTTSERPEVVASKRAIDEKSVSESSNKSGKKKARTSLDFPQDLDW